MRKRGREGKGREGKSKRIEMNINSRGQKIKITVIILI